jgi:hypothetical protein
MALHSKKYAKAQAQPQRDGFFTMISPQKVTCLENVNASY